LSKFILLLVVFAIAYWIIRSYRKKKNAPPRAKSEDMVRCAECGVHLPRSESLMSGTVFYCSAEHRREREKSG
jgi:uncharacterized protein